MSTLTAVERAQSQIVGMGKAFVGRNDQRLAAVLGSCIGLALVHRRYKAVALAHVVLPESRGTTNTPAKFADTAVSHLIELLRGAGVPSLELVAKIAGGANMFGTGGPMQMGEANAKAIERHLQEAKIEIVGRHLGGSQGRRVSLESANGEFLIEIVGQPAIAL